MYKSKDTDSHEKLNTSIIVLDCITELDVKNHEI